jgi:hypothetical protein
MSLRLQRGVRQMMKAVLVSTFLLAASASAFASTRVYVRVGPPAPIVEVRRVAPGPRYVWVPGYHTWSGRAYVWTPGVWAVPPRPRAVWYAPRWVHHHSGWYCVGGYWR